MLDRIFVSIECLMLAQIKEMDQQFFEAESFAIKFSENVLFFCTRTFKTSNKLLIGNWTLKLNTR